MPLPTGPFPRAHHVGSLIRPDNLISARDAASKHAITDAELKRIQEAAIRDVVRLQEDLGLKVVTDGEYNRGSWQRDFLLQFSNVAQVESKISVKFHNQQGVREHRMAVEGAELVPEPQQDRPRLRPFEQHLALAVVGFDAVERDQKVGLPGGAAELAVGDGLEADRLLRADHRRDRLVLGSAQLRGIDLAALVLEARLLEGGGPQQAAYMIGAIRRPRASQCH